MCTYYAPLAEMEIDIAYDNSDLDPSCDLLNMNCFWDFPDHFSSINLP